MRRSEITRRFNFFSVAHLDATGPSDDRTTVPSCVIETNCSPIAGRSLEADSQPDCEVDAAIIAGRFSCPIAIGDTRSIGLNRVHGAISRLQDIDPHSRLIILIEPNRVNAKKLSVNHLADFAG